MTAGKSPSSRATGTPHPGCGTVGWPNASWRAGGLGHGAARALDQTGAMAVPPPCIGHVGRHGSAQACSEEAQEVEGEFRVGLTVGRGAEAHA